MFENFPVHKPNNLQKTKKIIPRDASAEFHNENERKKY
jgi:hypothetical protein